MIEIPAIRISSAQASGAAKKYSYWGCAPYTVRVDAAHGTITLRAEGRAPSARRSYRLAAQDCTARAARAGVLDIGQWPLRRGQRLAAMLADPHVGVQLRQRAQADLDLAAAIAAEIMRGVAQ